MSSWSNRRQIHRRDLNQIPEELRPAAPIPRVDRTEVRVSESYHLMETSDGSPFFPSMGSHNPIYYPASSHLSGHTSRSVTDKRTSVSPQLASLITSLTSPHTGVQAPHPDAKELTVGGKTYVFVLLRHLQKPSDNDLWINSYNSIRRYYTNKIVIIDDNSQLNTVNGKLYQTDILTSDYAGAGETLPYYYFLMHRWADRMIFFHDTMFMYRPFRAEEVDTDARFHWSFLNKDTTSIVRLKSFLPSLRNHEALLADVDHPEQWRACFGVAMVVGIHVVEAIEEKYKLFSTMPMMIRNRKDREMAERLVGLVMFHEKIVSMDSCDNFGDILEYPKAFQSEWSNMASARYQLEQAGYGSAMMKVWRGR